ncbi:MAG: hypothetical protein ACK53G_03295, partial [Armatimonadota bacterium]
NEGFIFKQKSQELGPLFDVANSKQESVCFLVVCRPLHTREQVQISVPRKHFFEQRSAGVALEINEEGISSAVSDGGLAYLV